MQVLYLVLIVVGIILQNVAKKAYALKAGGGGAFTFSLVSVLCALLFFVFSGGFNYDFRPEVLPYSVGFAVSYGAAVVGALYAIKFGSLSLSSLISNYSLLLPTLFGILFLNEQISITLCIGIAVLMVSLFLVNYKPSGAEKRDRVDPRWFVCIAISFLGNGACSTVQVLQQKNFNGNMKSEFMIMALAIVAAILAFAVLVLERRDFVSSIKRGGLYMLVNGGFNGATNLFVMLSVALLPASVMYPIISAGGIIGTATVSVLFYRERLTAMQYVGFVLGIGAIVLLNL